MKQCPFCAEDIQADALVCPYCEKELAQGPLDAEDSEKRDGNEVSPAVREQETEAQSTGLGNVRGGEVGFRMKQCPFCAEDLQDDALVCPYCEKELTLVPVTLEDAPKLAQADTLGEIEQQDVTLQDPIPQETATHNVTFPKEDLSSQSGDAGAYRTGRKLLVLPAIALSITALLLLAWFLVRPGVFTINPIGQMSDGISYVYYGRNPQTPLFSSPDGMCLKSPTGVTPICRIAMLTLSGDLLSRALVKLPYNHWAYLQSTGGLEFDK